MLNCFFLPHLRGVYSNYSCGHGWIESVVILSSGIATGVLIAFVLFSKFLTWIWPNNVCSSVPAYVSLISKWLIAFVKNKKIDPEPDMQE